MEAVKTGRASHHPLPQGIKGSRASKAVIAVDLFGLPANYPVINRIAREYGAIVIEDAAQSFGAELSGQKAGSLAAVGCTSFFPAKPLGCYGDGGMCFTDDARLAGVMDSLRIHGKGSDKYDNVRIGINGRMDTLQAAIVLAKFALFPEEVELRQEVAQRYNQLLYGVEGLTPPSIPAGYKSVWAQYSVLATSEEHRKRLQEGLKQAGIPTAVYYPKPLHLQTAFSRLGYKTGDFPHSEDASRRIFSLPMHPYLSADDQEKIAAACKRIPN
jgi:dTDP-4-amino-4,6-dideoxygalactose transaminase